MVALALARLAEDQDLTVPRWYWVLIVVAVVGANMHLIAANSDVAAVIADARVGQILSLEGLLVDVRRPDGGGMRTSLTRDDTGAGACEIVWVERIGVR